MNHRTRTTLGGALRALPASAFLTLALAALPAAFAPPAAEAATQVPAARGRLAVDVWINKEEGGVFTSGEKMQVFFRANQDAYVLIYNIDTEGYIHLIYPFRPNDPVHVDAGETYRVPSRHDPYDLVAEGPEGMEYVVALASPSPFTNLPWFLAPGSVENARDRDEDGSGDDANADDDLDQGVIVGDPYVGMEKLNSRIVAHGREDQVATADTYFYIDRRVEYPRYVCADCHHRTYWFDPYVDYCSVVDIRIDATWARYAHVRFGSARPRYYYQVRSSAPTRFRGWKERWSSIDGNKTLRERFVLEREVRDRRLQDGSQRRQNPPEFKDLRRYRPGRFWQGRDQVIPLRERGGAQDKIRERIEQRRQLPPDVNRDRGDQRRGPPDVNRDRGDQRERRDPRDPGSQDEGRGRGNGPPPDVRQPERRRDEPRSEPRGDQRREESRPKQDNRDRSDQRGHGRDDSKDEGRSNDRSSDRYDGGNSRERGR